MTCKFKKVCGLYRNDSFTCRHVGGNDCGKYRELEDAQNQTLNQLINDELYYKNRGKYPIHANFC